MATTAGLRPTHYDILGVKPDATQAEIERAFRRELNPFMPHVVGGVAAASVAFATLSDPVRRRAYDEANGLRPPLAPATPALGGGGWAVGNSNVLRATPRPVSDLALQRVPESPLKPVSTPPNEPAAKPAVQRNVVAPQTPTARPLRPPLAALRTSAAEAPRPAPVILGMDDAEDAVIGGRKGAVILGAIAGVALVGGMLGWLAGSDAGDARAQALVTAVPKVKPRELSIITPAPDVVAPSAATEAAAASPAARPRKAPARRPAAVTETPVMEPAAAVSAEAPADALAPAPSPGEATPAATAMPIPARTVARTIDRIGYSCGTVTATEGAGGGIFTVTCSSGQRFRASPRAGRYRFKRI